MRVMDDRARLRKRGQNDLDAVSDSNGKPGPRPDGRVNCTKAPKFLAALAFLFTAVATVVHSIYRTPHVVAHDANARLFSEERALQHVSVLADTIGWRQVSHPGVFAAEAYIHEQALALQRLAAADTDATDPAIRVQVTVERFDGGVQMEFFRRPITNAFRNLTAVSWYVEPRAARNRSSQAILVMAHFDSPIASVGAADDASNVAVMLEAARALIAGRVQLEHPILFVANGGEETFSQAAYGFMKGSVWRGRIAAFINLEATGSGGLPTLFQGASPWTIRAYLNSGGISRGSSIAEDVFVCQIVPADTDFRMLSFRYMGSVPGLDIAYLLDAAAYHTDRDTTSRIRPGSIQEMGEKLQGLLSAFSKELLTVIHDPDTYISHERSIFFDTGFNFLVSYCWSTAYYLHSSPLILALFAPLFVVWAKSNKAGPAMVDTCWRMLTAWIWSSTTMAAVVAATAFAGVLRAALSGVPMVWFSNQPVAWLFYVPVAAATRLAMQRLPPRESPAAAIPVALPVAAVSMQQAQLLGAALTNGFLAAVLMAAGAGSSFLPAVWAWTALEMWFHFAMGRKSSQGWLVMVAVLFPVTCTSLANLIPLVLYLLGKVSMSGSVPGVLGSTAADAIIGVVMGLLVFWSLDLVVILLGGALPISHRRAALALLAFAAAVGVGASTFGSAYSPAFPKRVLVQHLHRQSASGSSESFYTIASLDPTPPSAVRASVPDELDKAHLGFVGGALEARPQSPRDWDSFCPLQELLQWETFAAPSMEQAYADDPDNAYLARPPTIVLRQFERHPHGDKYHLEIVYTRPSWATILITGRLLASSLSDTGAVVPLIVREGNQPPTYATRLASNDWNGRWPFSLSVEAGSEVQLNSSHAYLMPSKVLAELATAFPDWTHVLPLTVHQATFTFTNQSLLVEP